MCECDAHSAFGDLPDFNVYDINSQQNTALNILAQAGGVNIAGIVNRLGGADVTINSFTSTIGQIGFENFAAIVNFVGGSDVTDTNVQVNNVVNIIGQSGFGISLRLLMLVAPPPSPPPNLTSLRTSLQIS